MNLDIVCVVWGEAYTKLLLEFCIPSLLAPGNLPDWPYQTQTTLHIYTTPDDQAFMASAPVLKSLQRYIALCFHPLEQPAATANKYARMEHGFRTALRQARNHGHQVMLIMPDLVFSMGTLQVVAAAYQQGYDLLFTPNVRIHLQQSHSTLLAAKKSGVLPVSAEQCVALFARYMHPSTQAQSLARESLSLWPSHLHYWKDPHTLAMRCFHLHPLYMAYAADPGTAIDSTFDGAYLQQYDTNRDKIKFITDASGIVLSLTHDGEQAHNEGSSPMTFSQRLLHIDCFRRHQCQPLHQWFFEHTVELRVLPPTAHEAHHDATDLLATLDLFWQIEAAFQSGQYDQGSALLAQSQSRVESMMPLFIAALKDSPTNTEGNDLTSQMSVCQNLLKYDPENFEVLNHLGVIYLSEGQFSQAVECFKKSLLLKPEHADISNNLALLQIQQKHYENALDFIWMALPPPYQQASALYHLMLICLQAEEQASLQARLDTELFLNPSRQVLFRNLINFIVRAGYTEMALRYFEKFFATNLCDARSYSVYLFFLTLKEDLSPQQFREYVATWNQRFVVPLGVRKTVFSQLKKPNKTLRIGYVSGDFRRHSTFNAFCWLFEYHDHLDFEIYAYSNSEEEDEITDWIKTRIDGWRRIRSLSDEDVFKLVYERDQIDILVDLSGHTADNRLLVFAHKPAPIQITGLGFGSTTGLSTMDYRFTDRYISPPEWPNEGTEERIYLTSLICWSPGASDDARPLVLPPFLHQGYVTFGCVNSNFKMNPGTVALWSEILQQVPRSRLLLRSPGFELAAFQQAFITHFAKHGVDASRLIFAGTAQHSEYVKIYDQIDVALDPFPYNGGISTCDALWMGIPVITLDTPAGNRAGVSLLSQISATEWIAKTKADYVALAVHMAQEPQQLLPIRQQLRQRMLQSPICNGEQFTREVEQAYRQVWRKACR